MQVLHVYIGNVILRLIIFMPLMSIYSLEMGTNVMISNWSLPEDKLSVSCSISTNFKSEREIYKVHLICPLIDGNSCYVNCNSQCIQESGECINMSLKEVFYSCNYVRNHKNRIDMYYQLNVKNINVRGQWFCLYRGIRSDSIFIEKYTLPVSSSTITSNLSTEESIKPVIPFSKLWNKGLIKNSELKIIIIIITLAVSITINIILMALVCVTRKKLQKRRFKKKRKEKVVEPAETTSTRSSTRHQLINRSNFSGSLDSPSCRESITTYLPESSNVTFVNPTTTEPYSYYRDQCGNLFGILHSVNNYPGDGSDQLSQPNSRESNSSIRSVVNSNIFIPQLISTYGPYVGNWSSVIQQQQESFSSPRSENKKHQTYVDSSGLGSQSFSISSREKNESLQRGSGNVDLIVDCDPNLNNLIRSTMNSE